MKPASLAGAVLLLFLAATQEQGPLVVYLDNNCSFSYIKDVIVTDCHGLCLADVPADIPAVATAVTMVLNLSGNHLTHLAEQFLLSDCEASDQQSCSRFPAVSYLDLSFNQLLNLSSGCFSGMKDLRALYLGNNLLTTIPHDLFLDNRLLLIIDIPRNKLTNLPVQVFQNLTQALSINLRGNMLRTLHEDAFRGLDTLSLLDLQNNSITELQPHIFRDLKLLRELRINGNCLQYLPEQLLWNLLDLKTLAASHNHLTTISATFFANNLKLFEIDLSYNYIRELPRYVFMNLAVMLSMNVAFNNLDSVYLSQTPVTIRDSENIFEITPDSSLCKGLVNDIPCFVYETYHIESYNKWVFHNLDYSFNNISEIIFSKSNETHTLEFSTLSFAGNKHLTLPVSFIKQERYILNLDLNGTNLSWRNLTLLNEILELPQLKRISLVGSEACEFYTLQMLFSIFNPYLRVLVTCSNEHTYATTEVSGSTSRARNVTGVDAQDVFASNITQTQREKFGHNPNTSFDSGFCEYTSKNTVWYHDMKNNIFTICDNMVDCSYLSLSHLPELRPSLSCFLVSHNNIDVIEADYFDSSSELEGLDLSSNNLHHLPDNVFDALENLISLSIANNYLTSLNSSHFRRLINLGFLHLNGNRISSYSANVFETLGQLKLLSIDFENLTQLHDETFNKLSNLVLLLLEETTGFSTPGTTLTETHLKRLDMLFSLTIIGFKLNISCNSSFLIADHIQYLFVTRSIIQNLTLELFTTSTNITTLSFNSNQIMNVDVNAFSNLQMLQFLDLSENKIKLLHRNVFRNTLMLDHLNVSNNELLCISPTTFDSLKKLQILDLSNNMLFSLNNHMFAKLLSLQQLHAQNSTLSTVSTSDLGSCHCCEERELMPHPLATLSSANLSHRTLTWTAFLNNSQLTVLELKHNHIEMIDDKAFTKSINLLKLYLDFNSLTSINSYVFQNLTSLYSLSLSNNKLNFLEDRAFQDLRSLMFLHLEFNMLTSFHVSFVPNSHILRSLFLSDNYITILNLTLELQSLKTLYLSNNLLIDFGHTFQFLPSLEILQLRNISFINFTTNTLQNVAKLRTFDLGGNHVARLLPGHFSDMHRLVMLNLSYPDRCIGGEDAGISWRNITLINQWFEMPSLQFISLMSNPVCEDWQWSQVIQELFLSETWKVVMCSPDSALPSYYPTDDKVLVTFN